MTAKALIGYCHTYIYLLQGLTALIMTVIVKHTATSVANTLNSVAVTYDVT
jgi:hypothetical protein